MIAYHIFFTAALIFLALAGTAVVLTRDPKRQIFVAAIYGGIQTILFYLLQSPDVALSELAVGTVAIPLLVLATLAKLERS